MLKIERYAGPVVPNKVRRVNELLRQLSPDNPRQATEQSFGEAIVNQVVVFACCENGTILGMGTLVSYPKVSGTVGVIEEVVVDEEFRGRGIGKRIVVCLIAWAKEMRLKDVTLTSNEKRVEAHGLYRSLGFESYDTSHFRLKL